VRFPTFVWTTGDDAVVPSAINSDRLQEAIAGHKTGLEILKTPKGFHCNFASSYGWRQAGTIFRSLVLSQSQMELARELRSFRFPVASELKTGQKRVAYRFESYRGNLTLNDFRRSPGCESSDCVRGTRVGLNWSDLGLAEPRNDVETQAQIRFLNAHARLKGGGGEALSASENPRYIQITKFR
jgi:hypothetical protein